MPEQTTLPLSVDQDLTKWPRLAYCLDHIRRHGEVTATQIGAAWRIHGQGTWRFSSPKFDKENGNGIGKALHKRGLVKYRNRDGQRVWYAINPNGAPWHKPADPAEDCCSEFPFCRCGA